MSSSEDDIALAERILNRPRTQKRAKKSASSKKIDSQLEILGSYFERKDDGIYCKMVDCNTKISRWQKYYFKRHFDKKHPTLLRELFPDIVSDEI